MPSTSNSIEPRRMTLRIAPDLAENLAKSVKEKKWTYTTWLNESIREKLEREQKEVA